jgi:predicted membrane-bound dolichyl-phosphate-mannose-protein mannosyltransferase
VTGLGSGAPDRVTATHDAPRAGMRQQIWIVLAAGLLFRLILAYALPGLRGSGFGADLGLFNYWADVLRDQAPWGFYANASYADYTPGYLYALWGVGLLRDLGHALAIDPTIVDSFIKLPAIITDLVLGYLVYALARDLGVTHRRALIALAVVVFNPVAWFDSVIWGQVDSFGTVFLLLGVRELWRGRSERAAFFAVIAALVKPQLAILVPIVAIVVIRRAFWPAGGYGDEQEPQRRGWRWELQDIGWVRIVTTGLTGFLTAVLLSAPFGLTVIGFTSTAPFVDSTLVRLVFSTAAQYPYLTVNAYNWWTLLPVNGQSPATAGGALWIPDAPIKAGEAFGAIGPIPAALVGAALLLAVALVVAVVVARKPDRLTILVGVTVLALAFFAVPTRVHERYLFPFFALAGILIAFSWRWRIAYLIASIATFANMYVVLVAFYDNPQVSDWLGIAGALRETSGVLLIVALHTAAFLWGFAQLRPGARATLTDELDDGRGEEAFDEAELELPVPHALPSEAAGAGLAMASAGVPGARSGGGRTAAGAGAMPAAARLVPAWYDRPSWDVLGPIAWVRARMAETPIRPDRTASFANERGGRLDRLDLFIVIAVTIGALVLRTYRLDEPARMHFDEVYHARTATEFLMDWRYGVPPPQIYEWTHPHLAKYAMALGIVAFAGHDVASSSDLGVPVRDAVIEPHREDPVDPNRRAGDRAWVATGTEVIAYDLHSKGIVGRWSIPGASAVAWDATGFRVLVGTDGGGVFAIDGQALDLLAGSADPASTLAPQVVATVDGAVTRLAAYRDGTHAAVVTGDTVDVLDLDTGEVTGSTSLPGIADLTPIDDLTALVATPSEVTDPAAAAKELQQLLGGAVKDWEPQLAAGATDRVVLKATLTTENRAGLQKAIDDGKLPGIALEAVPTMAVADAAGVTFLAVDGAVSAEVPMERGAHGMALVTNIDDGSQLYVTTEDPSTGNPEVAIVAVSGSDAAGGPDQSETFRLPGAGTSVVFDDASLLVEVLGATPDGSGSTVYVVEPHGRAVFADHKLPFAPVAIALDHPEDFPSDGRGSLLAFGDGGQAASMDVGSYPFAWRLPGVILGALTAGALYLLARVLFRRRIIGVLAGAFVLLDGMFFVQSRIAMNDVYVGFFIVAAYLVFAWLWLDPWKTRRWFWVAMPVVGLLMGLALASKWVAAYAIGALGILILTRTALGRIILIAGLIGLTAVLGWMAIAVPVGSGGVGNLPFVVIMIALTLAAVVITVYHPVEWTLEEMWFAIAAPAALGILALVVALVLGKTTTSVTLGPVAVTPIHVALAGVLLGLAAYGAFAVGSRLGIGPMAPPPGPAGLVGGPPPAAAAPDGWVRLGYAYGLPAAWMLGSLLAIPLVVYVVSYIPWALILNHQLWPGMPPGHTGQTLTDLTGAMYQYHNTLTAAHPASSPWWAWPMNLKPVWFYQGSFANNMAAAIYDAGNNVIWWLGIPAMAFVAYQAFRRRSLALAMILIGFFAQWLSWSRIDRAAFQYHYYTSLPFIVLALAYFVGEVWTGASRRVWLLARVSAAVALMVPVILWLFRYPMCAIANVQSVNPGSAACQGNPGNLVVTPSTAAMAAVLIGTVVVVVWLLSGLGSPRAGGRAMSARDLAPLLGAVAVGAIALLIASLLPDESPLFTFNGIIPELIALIAAVPLGLVAVFVLTARDARRFVYGLVAAAGAWFVVLYPNISALAMPAAVVNAYQGLLPTYLYAFQFGVSTVDRNAAIKFATPEFAALVVALIVVSGVMAYAAWSWRHAAAEPVEESSGPAGERGAA